jgi:ferredoxin-NADP reductase
VRRKLRYESWHGLHLATYVAMWLSFSHQTESGGDFVNQSLYIYWYLINGAVVGVYFLYRFLRPFVLWYRHGFVVDHVVQESPDAWSVYITGRNLQKFRFEPGQFVNLHLLADGLWAGHPFSFSQEYNGSTLRFTIKTLGDGTGLIAHLKAGVHVLIDGPLGAFTPARAHTGRYLLIAGGIGITPVRAMAGELSTKHADVVVLYAARTSAHTALLDEVTSRVPRTHLFLSQADGNVPEGARRGQITAEAITSLVPDAASRDVFVCGPAPMMDAVTRELVSAGVPLKRIYSERFAY